MLTMLMLTIMLTIMLIMLTVLTMLTTNSSDLLTLGHAGFIYSFHLDIY